MFDADGRMRLDIVTIFPAMVEQALGIGVVGRAIERGTLDVTIHDLRGRAVRVWDLGTVTPGRQSVLWDGLDDDGQRCVAGVYFARVEWNQSVVATRRIVRL